MAPNTRPLESYSAVVLARWIRARGFLWFPEELEAIGRAQLRDDIAAGRVIEATHAEEPEPPEAA